MSDSLGTGQASTGYLFLNQELGKPMAALATFVGGGAGWAGAASHYTLAIVVGFAAAMLFALAFCTESNVKSSLKHGALISTLVLSLGIAWKANQYARDMIRAKAVPSSPVILPAGSGGTHSSVGTNGDMAPAVSESPGTVITYNSAAPASKKHKALK